MQCLHSKVMGQPVARGRIAQRLMPRAFSHRSQSLNAVPGLGPNMEVSLHATKPWMACLTHDYQSLHECSSECAFLGCDLRSQALLKTSGCMSLEDLSSVHFDRNHGDATVTKAWLEVGSFPSSCFGWKMW